MKKKKFTKDHIARKLGVQAYIIDGWEKQFELEPLVKNGEKLYTRKHVSQLRTIKELLYEKGFSLDAAKNYFKDQHNLEGTTLIAAAPLNFSVQQKQTPVEQTVSTAPNKLSQVRQKLKSVREQLQKISNSL